jgi:hypothetical protein
MNHVSYLFRTPISAVPVLPARRTPEIRRFVAVPPVTTDSIIDVSSSAVRGEITRRTLCGRTRRTTEPSGASTVSMRCGCMSTPPFATVAATIAICTGVTSIRSCPNASRPGSTWKAGRFGL